MSHALTNKPSTHEAGGVFIDIMGVQHSLCDIHNITSVATHASKCNLKVNIQELLVTNQIKHLMKFASFDYNVSKKNRTTKINIT